MFEWLLSAGYIGGYIKSRTYQKIALLQMFRSNVDSVSGHHSTSKAFFLKGLPARVWSCRSGLPTDCRPDLVMPVFGSQGGLWPTAPAML